MFAPFESVFLFLFGLIPGVPGEALYSSIVGLSWRENQIRRVTRILVISITGAILLVLTGNLFSYLGMNILMEPLHLMPNRLAKGIGEAMATDLSLAYLSHVAFSTFSGAVIGIGWDWCARRISQRSYPSAWESLVTNHSRDRWVVVTLKDGSSYAGVIESADSNVHRENRDMLLKEPAQYNEKIEAFVATRHLYLFLPAELIRSVAVVYDKDEDSERRTTVGEAILGGGYPDNGTSDNGPSHNGTSDSDSSNNGNHKSHE
jgi:hypothetical protein